MIKVESSIKDTIWKDAFQKKYMLAITRHSLEPRREVQRYVAWPVHIMIWDRMWGKIFDHVWFGEIEPND